MQLPSRLLRSRHGVFYFRLVIPRKLRALFPGQREARCSLRTTDPTQAAIVCHICSAHAHTAFGKLLGIMNEQNRNTKQEGSGPVFAESMPGYRLHISAETGITIEVRSGNAGDHQRALEAISLIGAAQFAGTFRPIQALESLASAPQTVGVPLRTSIDQYVKRNGERWSAKTRYEYGKVFGRFCEFVGPYPANAVTQKTFGAYVEALQKDGLCARTRDKYVTIINRYFKHATEVGEFNGTRIPGAGYIVFTSTERKKLTGWSAFDSSDLTTIFDPENVAYLEKPHEFWFPFLGLFTGARINELAQLAVSDVIDVDGIPAISINDDDWRKVKTEAGKRTIPIHSVLIGMGFLNYVADVRAISATQRLFPYLRSDQFGHFGDVPSEAFRRYLIRLGIKDKPGRIFHSFRKTANNRLKQNGVDEEHRCAMIGHAHETTNSSVYGEKLGVKFLADHVLPQLLFPEVDFARFHYEQDQMMPVLVREIARHDRDRARRDRRAREKKNAHKS